MSVWVDNCRFRYAAPKIHFGATWSRESLSRHKEESYTAVIEISIRPNIPGNYFILNEAPKNRNWLGTDRRRTYFLRFIK